VSSTGGRLRSFGAFWWDFVVGDDWTVAAGLVIAFAITAAIVHAGVPAWWVLPTAVVLLLAASLARTVRAARD